jgi:hypothetical protein
MPKYTLEVGGKTYDIESDKTLSDADLAGYATSIAGPTAAPSEVPSQRRPAGAMAQVGRAAASLADITLGGVAPAIVQQLAYPVARMGQTAPEATATARRLSQPLEQPFGRAFGVTETPEYQQEPGRQLVEFIGQNLQKGTQWLSERTGLPAADIENMAGSLGLALPKVAGATVKAIPEGVKERVGQAVEQTGAALGSAVKAIPGDVRQRVGLATEQLGATLAKPFDPQIQLRRGRQSLEDYARGPQIDAAAQAQRLGIALDPTVIQPSPGTRVQSLIASGRLNDALVDVNRGKVRDVALNEMGLPPTAQLNGPAAFNQARAQVAGPYNEIAKLPIQRADASIITALDNIRPAQSLIGKESSASAVNALVDDAIQKTQGGLTGAELLDNIRSLRRDAQKLYKNKNATPAQIDIADANLAIASQLEAMIDSSIFNPRLLSQFQAARQNMARIYAYEAATDLNTGIVDVGKLARVTSKDNALTGDIAALGQIAGNFPDAFSAKPVSPVRRAIPPVSRATIGGAIGAVVGSPFGVPGSLAGMALGGALGEGIGALTAGRLASPGYQAGLSLRDRRIPVNQLAEPAPPIPQGRAIVPFDPRNALVNPTDIVGYTPDGSPITAQQAFSRPNFTLVSPSDVRAPLPDVRVVPPGGFPELPAPSSASRLESLRLEDKYQLAADRYANQLAEARQAAAARQPTRGEVILDFDPFIGKLRETSRGGLKGATPETFENFGADLASAADKITEGRRFALSATEKIAWERTKVDLSEVAPGFKALNDKAIAEKMMDRQWVSQTVQKARDKAAAFAQIEARAKDAAARRQAVADRERMLDIAEQLEEGLRAPRPVSTGSQGPKTRAFQRNRLISESQNNLSQ